MRKRDLPVKRCLVRTVVKHLQELTTPQVEHELWVNAEIVRQPKARWVFLPVVRKLLTQPDQHTIQPSQHVG